MAAEMIISVIHADITALDIDVIVNAANSSLLGGGGVDGAIHRAGGPSILEECMAIRNRQGGCPTGEAVITTAGKMKAKKVIHTVGPIWKGGGNDEDELLRACYVSSLVLAEKHSLRRIAFPNISTGVYGFPKERAAGIAVEAVRGVHSDVIEEVVFVCFDSDHYALYKRLLE